MKKKETLKIILIVLFIISIVSFSLGYWVYVQKTIGKGITARGAKLFVNLTGTTTLNISNAKPISEGTYLEEANYIDFTATGEGNTINGCYKVELNVISISANFSNTDFKWVLYDKNQEKVLTTGTFQNVISGTQVLLLDYEPLSKYSIDNYRFFVYLEDNPDINQVSSLSGASISAKIKLTSSDNNCSSIRNKYDYVYDESIEYYTFNVPVTEYYEIELWGAQGGNTGNTYTSGMGGYTHGKIFLNKGDAIYIYIGSKPTDFNGGYNGGGSVFETYYTSYLNMAGGGSTDIRLISGTWDNMDSLNSRIMVAGGGGGANGNASYGLIGSDGGGLIGIIGNLRRASGSAAYTLATGGTQMVAGTGGGGGTTSYIGLPGAFGKGGSNSTSNGTGGGGGYYGGGAGGTNSSVIGTGGGGSSFISGHQGCVAVDFSGAVRKDSTGTTLCNSTSSVGYNADGYNSDITCSEHYSDKKFTNTLMIDGSGQKWVLINNILNKTKQEMPNPHGGKYTLGTGNTGNGYARIKILGFNNINEIETDFKYTGSYQEYIVTKSGYYKIELWGASGNYVSSANTAGKGAYTSGIIKLNSQDVLKFFVGNGNASSVLGGYNGGGNSGTYNTSGGGGGGATDVRFGGSELENRIMVAGGGAGEGSTNLQIPHAGGLNGYNSRATSYEQYGGNGGSQISGGIVPSNYSGQTGLTAGSFGLAGNGNRSTSTGFGSGGGGGWYGGSGGSGASSGAWSGGGGSSFISGHRGCVAVTSTGIVRTDSTGTTLCSSSSSSGYNASGYNISPICSKHYSNKVFTDTLMIDGAGQKWDASTGTLVKTTEAMPNPTGGYYASGVGHTGSGYAKITYVNSEDIMQENRDFEYIGDVQEYPIFKSGYYEVELWGAQGGDYNSVGTGGKGGYTKGTIYLESGEILYAYVGQRMHTYATASFNGTVAASGGGATDVRCFYNGTTGKCTFESENLEWNNNLGLKSRIMVAAGGAYYYNSLTPSIPGAGGGLIGLSGSNTTGGTQWSYGENTATSAANASFGLGGSGYGGGGGWYGGGGGVNSTGSGGSSFISGHPGCVAIDFSGAVRKDSTGTTLCNSSSSSGYNASGYNVDSTCSEHYGAKTFSDTLMIDGTGQKWQIVDGLLSKTSYAMPNPLGGTYASGTGHTGNGYAKISYIGDSI